MERTSTSVENMRGKEVLVIILLLTFLLVALFWVATQIFQLKGLPLYFTQIGLYLLLFLLACWGLKQEQMALPIGRRQILEALAWTLVSWLFFVLLIQVLGMLRLADELQALKNIPAWKIGLQILSAWVFVGMGEEILFRGYVLNALRRHFTRGTDRRRIGVAFILSSVFFSLWHFPSRLTWLISGEVDLVLFLVSFLALFLLGLGYAWLFVRSENILLTGLVHGLSDLPLLGKGTDLTAIILLAAIGCVEISRWIARKKGARERIHA